MKIKTIAAAALIAITTAASASAGPAKTGAVLGGGASALVVSGLATPGAITHIAGKQIVGMSLGTKIASVAAGAAAGAAVLWVGYHVGSRVIGILKTVGGANG